MDNNLLPVGRSVIIDIQVRASQGPTDAPRKNSRRDQERDSRKGTSDET